MKPRLFDVRMTDGSRHFGELDLVSFFDIMRGHLALLEGAVETGFVTDWVTEMWLDFDFCGNNFSINNQLGWYWLFVKDPDCPDSLLEQVLAHFELVNPPSLNIAFFGGTFDPVHCGHMSIGQTLVDLFDLDKFFFLPAFHAPHKPDTKPTSGYHRFAMLSLATSDEPRISLSTLELDHAESRYSFDTLSELKSIYPNDRIFFVMGADSWMDIRTWHRWEEVLLLTDHIVVSRPGYEVSFDHVSDQIRERIVDARGETKRIATRMQPHIYFTDAVHFDISATEIREDVRQDDVLDRRDDVPDVVAKYIEKYELYR